MKNLFSVLSEQQINSLTKEERDQLLAIDEKLFPGDGGGGEPGLHNKEWLEKKLAAMNKEREDNEYYAKELEKSWFFIGMA